MPTDKKVEGGPISLSAYGRHRKCSPQAISQSLKTGKLKACIVFVGGQPKIRSAEAADAEWSANCQRPWVRRAPPPVVHVSDLDPERSDADLFVVVRLRDHVRILALDTVAAHSVRNPDSYVAAARSGRALEAEADVLFFEMTPGVALDLAAALIEKAQPTVDTQ